MALEAQKTSEVGIVRQNLNRAVCMGTYDTGGSKCEHVKMIGSVAVCIPGHCPGHNPIHYWTIGSARNAEVRCLGAMDVSNGSNGLQWAIA